MLGSYSLVFFLGFAELKRKKKMKRGKRELQDGYGGKNGKLLCFFSGLCWAGIQETKKKKKTDGRGKNSCAMHMIG